MILGEGRKRKNVGKSIIQKKKCIDEHCFELLKTWDFMCLGKILLKIYFVAQEFML